MVGGEMAWLYLVLAGICEIGWPVGLKLGWTDSGARPSWIIFAVVAMSTGKPPELLRTALTRAYFCEDFSASAGLRDQSSAMFLMGLLSVSDALLDKPIADVLESLPIDAAIKAALCGGENRYRDLYEVLLSLEHAEWRKLTACTDRLGCPEDSVPTSYQSALQKASSISA